MAHEWREVLLEDVTDELTVGYVGPMASEYVDAGVPFLRSLNVEPLRINKNDLKFITPEFHQRIRKSRLTPGDVVIVRTGKPGACSVVPEWLVDGNCSDLVIVRCGTELNNRFLAYYINTVASGHVAAHLVGAVQQHFNVGSARTLRVNLPPLAEQQAIVEVLGTLDDKIELNRRMNETLEGMARAIFKSWFVDFDPVRAKADGRQPPGLDPATAALFPDSFEDSPLGKIPKGWKVAQLNAGIALSKNTVSPSAAPKEVFQHYSIPAFDDGAVPRNELGESIKSNKFLVLEGSILVSKLNPRIPRVWIPATTDTLNAVASTEFLVACPKNSRWREFYVCLFKSAEFTDELATRVTGTSGSHQRVRPDDFLQIDHLMPSTPVVESFGALAKYLFDSMQLARCEAGALANIRDALLPKLLSGEVRVPEAERLIGRAV